MINNKFIDEIIRLIQIILNNPIDQLFDFLGTDDVFKEYKTKKNYIKNFTPNWFFIIPAFATLYEF